MNWLNTDKGAPAAYKFDANGEFQLWASTDPGFNPTNPFRNLFAQYFLPSADEWYKAAFYDPQAGVYWEYPTGSNNPPTPVASGSAPGTAVFNQAGPADVQLAGGMSPFGVLGLAGNVSDFEETSTSLLNNSPTSGRGARGESWEFTTGVVGFSKRYRGGLGFDGVPGNVGIRIASVPEPNSLALATLCSLLSVRSRPQRRPR